MSKVISIKLLCTDTEITLRHECSPVNLMVIFRTPFPRNTSGQLPLIISLYNMDWKYILEQKLIKSQKLH